MIIDYCYLNIGNFEYNHENNIVNIKYYSLPQFDYSLVIIDI